MPFVVDATLKFELLSQKLLILLSESQIICREHYLQFSSTELILELIPLFFTVFLRSVVRLNIDFGGKSLEFTDPVFQCRGSDEQKLGWISIYIVP